MTRSPDETMSQRFVSEELLVVLGSTLMGVSARAIEKSSWFAPSPTATGPPRKTPEVGQLTDIFAIEPSGTEKPLEPMAAVGASVSRASSDGASIMLSSSTE